MSPLQSARLELEARSDPSGPRQAFETEGGDKLALATRIAAGIGVGGRARTNTITGTST